MHRFRVIAVSCVGAAALVGQPARAQPETTLFVPVILSSSGLNGSFFTSEMVETNRGSSDVTVSYSFTASIGAGSGTVNDSAPLLAGHQRVIPDAIVYLRGLGLPIPSGQNVVGTLRATFSNLSDPSAAAIVVRTTTPVPVGNPIGRAGLAYLGLQPAGLLYGTAWLAGLRQNTEDRTNVAVQNAGAPTDGPVSLRLTWIPSGGPPGAAIDVTLQPGDFVQHALTDFAANASEGQVQVDVISGTAPYYTYAVVNDQVTSDGSFLTPVASTTGSGANGLTLPTAVETSVFKTEVVVTNLTSSAVSATLTYITASFGPVPIQLMLGPYQQVTYSDYVQSLRDSGVPGIPAPGATITGTLLLTVASGDVSGLFLGGRTLNAASGGGYYGVFTTAQPFFTGFVNEAWLFGLRQDSQNRTNVALVNPGDSDPTSTSQLQIEIFDGNTGLRAAVVNNSDTTVAPGGFQQINSILSTYAPATTQGYARVTTLVGNNQPVVYAVVNDGAQPGQRSGDGAVIPMSPFETVDMAGSWQNNTFGTTGPASAFIAADRISHQAQLTLTLGGNVFGGSAPPPQTLVGLPDSSVSMVTFSALGNALFGNLSATVDNEGNINGSATSIPSPNVSSMMFTGAVTQNVVTAGGEANVNYTLNLIPSGTATGTLTLASVQ